MSKIQLPNVTLIAITGIDYKTEEHKRAIEYSCLGIDFGEVKIAMLEEITDINSWNKAVIYELPKFINTDYCILIHSDGYITSPHLWKDEWLEYDWASSPWPLPKDDYSYRDEEGGIVRVGNSVSLRSKKLMDLIATKPEKEFWAIKEKYGNTNEDGFICSHNRKWLESQGCKFMPFKEAIYFGKETPLPENKGIKTFLFHKYQ